MTDLPQGTVAYLMSDIEGSTRLVRDLGPAFPALLGDHFRLLGDAVSSNGGTLVSSEGDSIFAVFPSVRQAVLAAVGGQRSLAAHHWPDGATVRVRMGIHAGEAVFGGTDYTGLEVHRTARIMAAGHGGQVLLSAAARSLAGDVGDGIGFRDAGTYQLRDMPAPDEVIQLTAEGLPTEFPPLRTQRPTVPTNLPTPLTRFVGRSMELVTAVGLLNETRLLTLTGPGGTGKTRLSIEVGRNGLDQFPDGVWFVGLDVLRDPALVMTSVGRALGVPEAAGVGPLDALAKHLAGHATLIVLDNLEQVIAAASDVATLLAAAPGITILATSREPLAIAGERVYAVPPLAVPDEPGNPTAATLVGNDCVDLFVERARAARAEFALTDANAAAVAAICRRLDGLPLALELAAARINVLSPDQILARMDHRLTLLASSRRDLTDRQRTLRGAIEWSYDLLTEPERTFFRRFAVFAGGADLDAAQTVIDPEIDLGADALDLASALVDRSLLRATEAGGANRLVLLETIREYASDRLAEAATEAEAVRNRHAAHYRALAVASAGVLTDPRRDAMLDQLDRELPNFRAAIDWAVAAGDLDAAVEIAASLRDFWHTRAHLVEARQLVGKLLEATGDRPGPSRIRLLFTMSEVASWNGEYAEARRAAAEGLAIAQEIGDALLLAQAYQGLGWATFMGDPAFGRDQFAKAIEYGRQTDDLPVVREALQGYAIALMRLGDWEGAAEAADEAIAVADRHGDRYLNSFNHLTRGFLKFRKGDIDGALADHLTSVREASAAGSAVAVAVTVEAMAIDAVELGDPRRAVVLATGATRLRESVGGGPSVDLAGLTDPLVLAAERLDEDAFSAAADEGRRLSMEELVALALAVPDRPT